MRIICSYSNFKIFLYTEDNRQFYWAFDESDKKIYNVEIVGRVNQGDYENMSDEELINSFPDEFDYSGEADDCSAYYYWRVVK